MRFDDLRGVARPAPASWRLLLLVDGSASGLDVGQRGPRRDRNEELEAGMPGRKHVLLWVSEGRTEPLGCISRYDSIPTGAYQQDAGRVDAGRPGGWIDEGEPRIGEVRTVTAHPEPLEQEVCRLFEHSREIGAPEHRHNTLDVWLERRDRNRHQGSQTDTEESNAGRLELPTSEADCRSPREDALA